MADTTYYVNTKYQLDTKEAEEGVDRLGEMFERLKKVAEFALVSLGIEKLIDKTIELGSEVENTKIKLAGMMTAAGAPGARDFNQSLQMAGVLVEDLRDKSAKLPGTWQDLSKIVNTITVPGLNVGKSMNDITDLASKAQALFIPQGSDSGQIAHSMRAMLAGHARGMDPIFQQLSAVMKDQGQGFNNLTASDRYETVLKALEKFDPAMKAFQTSWIAVSTTTKNYLELITEEGTGKLFEGLKATLSSINQFISDNKATIYGYAQLIGGALADAFAAVGSVVKAIGPPIMAVFSGIFAVIKETIGGAWDLFKGIASAIASIFPSFESAKGNLTAFGNVLGWVISVWGAYKIAVGLAEVAQWAWNIAAAANPIGLIVLAVAALVAGIALLIARMDDLRDTWTIMANDPKLRAVADKLGMGTFMGASDPAEAQKARENMAKRHYDLVMQYGDDGNMAQLKKLFEPLLPGAMKFDTNKSAVANEDQLKKLLDTKGTAVRNSPTNINVKIEQTIEDATDPERILIKTKEALDQALIHPIESGYQPFSTMR